MIPFSKAAYQVVSDIPVPVVLIYSFPVNHQKPPGLVCQGFFPSLRKWTIAAYAVKLVLNLLGRDQGVSTGSKEKTGQNESDHRNP